MGLKTETETIDGLEVSCTQFPAMRSLGLMTRLGNALAPMLAVLPAGTSLDSDATDVAPALGHALGALKPEEAQALVRDVVAGTSVIVDGKRVELTDGARIGVVFDGRLGALLQVAWFAIRVNFADFIGAAQKAGDLMAGATKPETESGSD